MSKIDALGKRLQRATSTPFFQFELVKQKKKSSKFRKMGLFLKAVYLVNLIVCLSAMATVTAKQIVGDLQCEEITFNGEHQTSSVVIVFITRSALNPLQILGMRSW